MGLGSPHPRAAEPLSAARLTLMIDADDTLWENNILFERAMDRFVEIVAHPHLSPAEVRAAFDALEATRIRIHGYGSNAFHQSMLAGFEKLTGAACDATQAECIQACARSIRLADLEMLQGVAETLPHLAARHAVLLVTKGDPEEQHAKLAQSGLAHHFQHVEVLREKHTTAYVELVERYGCDPQATWMIGNSPKSDINPALAAGLHAAYLPHPSTWIHEREALHAAPAGQRLLHLETFADLLHHF